MAYGEECTSGDWGMWQPAAPIPDGRRAVADAQCRQDPGGYYKVGGEVGPGTWTGSMWRYDFGTDAWTELAPHPTAAGTSARMSAICTADGKIHVVGGASDEPGSTATGHHVYDIATDTWTAAAPLPQGVHSAAMGAWEGKVYVLGGTERWTASVTTDRVQVYDIGSDTWSDGQPMPAALGLTGHTQVGSQLYIVGGDRYVGSVDRVDTTYQLDLATGQWSSGPRLRTGRAIHTLIATDQALYAVGGVGPSGYPTTVERLELGSWPAGTWTEFHPLREPRVWLGGACGTRDGTTRLAAVGGSEDVDENLQVTVAGESCAFGP